MDDSIWAASKAVALAAGVEEGITAPFDGCKYYLSGSVSSGNSSLDTEK